MNFNALTTTAILQALQRRSNGADQLVAWALQAQGIDSMTATEAIASGAEDARLDDPTQPFPDEDIAETLAALERMLDAGYIVDSRDTPNWFEGKAESPRDALAAMLADIGQGEQPGAQEYVETGSQGPWVYRTTAPDGSREYFAMPDAA